jgi:hypothetical protein
MATSWSGVRRSVPESLEAMRRGEYRKSGLIQEVDVKSSEQRARGQGCRRAHVRRWTALTLTTAWLVPALAGAAAPPTASPVPTSQAESEQAERARAAVAASNVESTETAMQSFTGSDAAALVKTTIEAQTKANDGLYPVEDALHGDHLKLAFDDVDFTRTIDGYGFFPDVKFHDPADARKKYLIDFWVVPVAGQLTIEETRIYKEPFLSDGQWTTMARQPVPWWWIPASEHPGHLATKRGWEVMSAVEHNAMRVSAENHGVFKLKDDKTGKVLELEFVDTHQPVRQLDSDGHYFACTDFRVVGTKDEIYDIDFWVTDKNGTMSVDQTKVHKVPELKDGQWVQVPRYEWKDLGSSHVVP